MCLFLFGYSLFKKLELTGGIQLNFLTTHTNEITYSYLDDEEGRFLYNPTKLDVGLFGGLNYSILNKTSINLKYYHGFQKVNSGDGSPLLNRWIEATIQYTPFKTTLFKSNKSQLSVNRNWGLFAGLNYSNIGETVDTYFDRSGVTGPILGILYQLNFNKFALFPQLYYSQIGAVDDEKAGHQKTEFEYDFLNLPIPLKYYPFDIIGIYAGPQFSYIIDGRGKSTDYFGEVLEVDYNYLTSRFKIFLLAGVSIEPGRYIFQLSYSLSGNDFATDSHHGSFYSFQLSGGIRF